ncbi:SRPBCC family protein [Streptomyces sp. enrichment culture]|uniref:SRPBCC family protein n=1 Tax=Streptomyces sp. enrichment culture TaxID=1795815 RepID=UPI003F562AE5
MSRTDWNHYRFHSRWTLPAPPAAVFAVLEHPEHYPRWWPQVREARRVDDRTVTARVRSAAPYTLAVTLVGRRRDPAARVLETALTGDLEGWARWTLAPHGDGGTLAEYEQDVHLRAALPRRVALLARPLLRANHALMMRAGRRALAAHLKRFERNPPGPVWFSAFPGD